MWFLDYNKVYSAVKSDYDRIMSKDEISESDHGFFAGLVTGIIISYSGDNFEKLLEEISILKDNIGRKYVLGE